MRKPIVDIEEVKKRRAKLAQAVESENSAFILFSGKAPTRSNDSSYKFRVDNNFFYLTGYEEENAILVFRPGQEKETTVFVHKKDPLMETWEGFLFGPEAAQKEYQFDQCFELEDFEEKIVELLSPVDKIYYRMGLDKDQDQLILNSLSKVLRAKGRKGSPFQSVHDPSEHLANLRIYKSPYEQCLMRKTCQISAEAHVELMKHTKVGMGERQLEGLFLASIMKEDARAEAYSSIVARGPNATTLHYVFNDDTCKDGDLILIDAGSEYQYYAGDITRTYPVNGKFSKIQRELYQAVLEVQKSLIAVLEPGTTFKDLNELAAKKLCQVMIDFKLLEGSVDQNLESQSYKKYYPHSIGHYLGLDVHDVGYYQKNNEPVPFKEGVVLTIEPGIYIPQDDLRAPEEMRGLGIRIEDDVLITATGHEVLTHAVPKEVDEIESLMQS